MALRKPSDLFGKKDTIGVFENPGVSFEVSESYDKFKNNFEKVNKLSEKVEELSQKLSEKLSRTDLENAMLSQLMVLDENFKALQNQVKGLNKQDLRDFKEVSSNLKKIVENIVEVEIPKYKKKITKSEVYIEEQVTQIKETLDSIVSDIREDISVKLNDVADVVDNNINYFNQQLQETSETCRKEIADVKADVVINEQHIKKVDEYIKENYSQIVDLREEVFAEIEKLPVGNLQENIERLEKKINFIRETYSKIEPEVIVKEVIKEGLLNEPPETKNQDTLTPLNQNFVTLDQLQDHYRLFINRIQQQLSTLGGGGETQLKYLDDIVGIATNPSAYNNKFLRYNHSIGKFEFVTVSGGGGGITLEDLSATVSSPGISTLTYDNTTGVFNYTPPNLTGYATTQSIVGFITSGASGSNLTGIVTSITAGSGISINQSTGNVTITATGGGGGTQTLDSTLGYGNTSSLGMNVGVVTASSFVGNLTGTATTATTVDILNTNGLTTVYYPTFVENRTDGQILRGDVDLTYRTDTNTLTAQKISSTQINVSGVVTASSFSGNGSNLTGIVTFITAGSGISVNQNTGNVTITNTGASLTGNNVFTGINTFTGSNTFSGSIIIEQASEVFNKYSTTINASAVVTLDCSTGNIHYITSTVGGNWTANLTNVGITSGHCANYTLVINQGTTAYIPNALQIAGVTTSINWQGGSLPTGNNNKKDVIAYTIFDDAGSYTVFGQLVTFG